MYRNKCELQDVKLSSKLCTEIKQKEWW